MERPEGRNWKTYWEGKREKRDGEGPKSEKWIKNCEKKKKRKRGSYLAIQRVLSLQECSLEGNSEGSERSETFRRPFFREES